MVFFEIPIEGGIILTQKQVDDWQAAYPEEFAEYSDPENGLLYQDEDGQWILLDIPEWMENGDPNDGPFDFILNPSQKHTGW